jgi:hypothetical protein
VALAAVDLGRIVVDEDVKKRKAKRIVGLLEIFVLLIVIGGGGALWLMAIRAPDTSSPAAAVTEPGTGSIRLAWDKSPSQKVAGYKILFGFSPRTYTDSVSVGNEGTVTLTRLKNGTRYYIVVVAVDAEGNQSAPSNEIEAVASN